MTAAELLAAKTPAVPPRTMWCKTEATPPLKSPPGYTEVAVRFVISPPYMDFEGGYSVFDLNIFALVSEHQDCALCTYYLT
jgi:hypothetical protein